MTKKIMFVMDETTRKTLRALKVNPQMKKVSSLTSFMKWIKEQNYGTARLLSIASTASLYGDVLHNLCPGNTFKEISVEDFSDTVSVAKMVEEINLMSQMGTNRVDDNLTTAEEASHLGLMIANFMNLTKKDKNGKTYYDPAVFTAESNELRIVIYACEIGDVLYLFVHDGGHRLRLIDKLLSGYVFPRVNHNGSQNVYIDYYNDYIAGKKYGYKSGEDENGHVCDTVFTNFINEVITTVPYRIVLEREDYDMAIRCISKPYKNAESTHKNNYRNPLYQYLFNTHKEHNDKLNIVANSKFAPLNFCNTLATHISLMMGQHTVTAKEAAGSLFYSFEEYASETQKKRTYRIIDNYVAIHSDPVTYPFLRSAKKTKFSDGHVEYCGVKNGFNMVNSRTSVKMVLDIIYGDAQFQGRFADEFAAYKKKEKIGSDVCSAKIFREFFESTFCDKKGTKKCDKATGRRLYEARLLQAEAIIALYKKNAKFFLKNGNNIASDIAVMNITDGTGRANTVDALASLLYTRYFANSKFTAARKSYKALTGVYASDMSPVTTTAQKTKKKVVEVNS